MNEAITVDSEFRDRRGNIGIRPASDVPHLLEAIQSLATWRTAGFSAQDAYASKYNAPYEASGAFGHKEDQRLPAVADSLDVLHVLDVLDVRPVDARTVAPIPGAFMYLDPPYLNTTNYGCDLPRTDVIAVAERWRAAGCTVAVSEAEPLPIPGWHHYELGKPIGNRRTWSKQKREWLTLSERPVGVFNFGTPPTTATGGSR